MLSEFEVVLLDLKGAFMFCQDRFGPDQDYGATYREAGGAALSSGEVTGVVDDLVYRMTALGGSSQRYDSFPSVTAVLRSLDATSDFSTAELERIERVVAAHELGQIPADYAKVVRELSEPHRPGIVSNLWSRKAPWLAELERVGLRDAFEWLVFSSDGHTTKPSPRIFNSILYQLQGILSRVLMIEDSLERDVIGAHVAGISAMLISAHNDSVATSAISELQVESLLELGNWSTGS